MSRQRVGSQSRGFRVRGAVTAVALLVVSLGWGSSHAAEPVRIEVLSNRADLISGGDALVRVDLPSGVSASDVTMKLGADDVTSQFALRANGNYEGLLTGLALGPNTLQAVLPDSSGAQITITNHPLGGPTFFGPQVQPWSCQTSAVDPQCNQPATYAYYYVPQPMSVGRQAANHQLDPFQSYDPSSPPPAAVIASTTTTDGTTVPYIVRVETGYINRDQYAIAVLYDPAKPWTPWSSQAGWNHKVLINHGIGCNFEYQTGTAPSTLVDVWLSSGFAVMSHALDNATHTCNVVLEAESLQMTKEHLIERYGEIKFTVAMGGSGGSIAQMQEANAYPGLFQGLMPTTGSFMDMWTNWIMVEDYHLIDKYLLNPAGWQAGVVWDPRSIAAIEGYPTPVEGLAWDVVFAKYPLDPTRVCVGLPPEQVWNAQTNPDGIRCTAQDYSVNMFGLRQPSVWTPLENQIGHGWAGRPYDNVGVQYGVRPLMAGQITPAQFVDLNSKVGGMDINFGYQPQRVAADEPALANAYRTGAINAANGLADMAILNIQGNDNGNGTFHSLYNSYMLRQRLQNANGTSANHVLWTHPVAPVFSSGTTQEGFIRYQAMLVMNQWLDSVYADTRDIPLSQKVIEDKPAAAQDRCFDAVGQPYANQDVCTALPVYETPRKVAGAPMAGDVMKCQLKPLERTSYYPVRFTDAQWAALEQTFPNGVCDYTKPGVSQQPTVPWLSYGTADTVIYGGQPLGPPPVSIPS